MNSDRFHAASSSSDPDRRFSHNEIKPPKAAIVRVADAQDQPPVKQTISAVERLAWKVQLGCEYAAAGLLDLNMIMTGSAGICCWHNGGKPPATVIIGVLIAPQPVTCGVVGACLVGVPDLHKCLRHWSASRIEHEFYVFLPLGRVWK
jgi:hypothetical protein